MLLHLSVDFDAVMYTPEHISAGYFYAGPRRLLEWLEAQLGRSGYPEKTDYLRVEFYRQALQQYIDTIEGDVFFKASFEADRFSTALALLDRRDELVFSGWRPSDTEQDAPERLRVFSLLEQFFLQKVNQPEYAIAAIGLADRWAAVFEKINVQPLPVSGIVLHDPEELMPVFLRRFVDCTRDQGVPVRQAEWSPRAREGTDLGNWQRRLSGDRSSEKHKVASDGSIVLVRAGRDAEAARYIARLLAENRKYRPLVLLPEMNRQLEQALILEGMPALGIQSASLARPSLQVLKLAPAFLWEPVDVYKIMEFVTLPVKPLDDDLAQVIARVLADRPGLFSDNWFGAVLSFLERDRVSSDVREQYAFFFDRRRYPIEAGVPRRDAIGMYAYLHRWAMEVAGEATGNKEAAMLVLAEQARRIRELLEALPDERLRYLELERIVRTIYEPSPMQLDQVEEGRLDFVHSPGAVAAEVPTLVWWNFRFEGATLPADFWHKEERSYVLKKGIELEHPDRESQRRLFQQKQAIMRTSEQLILICPERVEGAEVQPHLLLGDLQASFGDIEPLWCRVDDPALAERIDPAFHRTEADLIPVRPQLRTRPLIKVPSAELLPALEYDTVTQIEAMLYYPHRWFFRQNLKLYPGNLLRVRTDAQLLGNLSHRFLELLLAEDTSAMDQPDVYHWVDRKSAELFEKEGAPLLLYGREPERRSFIKTVQRASWTLISMLRENNWQVVHTELPLEGTLGDLNVRAKADLVLQRDHEYAIVDFKWGGASRRREMIRNNEDLQLVLYAHLLPPPDHWPHTAYFILEDARMIARNRKAFSQAVEAGGIEDHAESCALILNRILHTYRWREHQIRSESLLELRTSRTAPELSAMYGDMLDLLEMKEEDARWDDYRFLIA